MSVSFSKNKDALIQAWRDVLDNDNKTDWALFGYESQSFDLKVTGTGDGGLEEMIEDLNSGKIMYAFCRVMDPKTSLPKFVLINWQGEGAPGERKGKCANHFMDIANFFHGAHVTVHARTEDDVDPSVIIGMVSKATGSAYSFKERADPLQNHAPVSSVYKRTNPAIEINPSERHKFWEKQETEEKSRIEGDRKRAVEMQQQLEKERQEREAKDAQRREQMVAERVKSINHLRQLNDQSSVNTASAEMNKNKAEVKKNDSDGLNRQQSGKQASVDRRLEAQNLIGQRTTNARTIFEQHTSVGQMSRFSNINKAVQEVSDGDTENQSLSSADSLVTHLDTESRLSRDASLAAANDDCNFSNGANNTVKSPEGSQYHPFTGTAQERNPVLEEDQLRPDKPSTCSTSEELKNYDDSYLQTEEPYVGGQGLMARALYDYQAADDTEISFNPDDIITNIDQIDEGWWQGLAPDGLYGLFPANYVQVIDNLND